MELTVQRALANIPGWLLCDMTWASLQFNSQYVRKDKMIDAAISFKSCKLPLYHIIGSCAMFWHLFNPQAKAYAV